VANTTAGIEADPDKRIKALETEVRDLKTRVEVLERFLADRWP
jgi:uncharacterized protein YceH (UPF0502 family)